MVLSEMEYYAAFKNDVNKALLLPGHHLCSNCEIKMKKVQWHSGEIV